MYIKQDLLRKPEYTEFKKLVYKVADTARPSAIKEKPVEKLYRRVRTSQVQNERTVLSNILPNIITESRSISLENPDNHGLVMVTDEDFDETGLDWIEEQEVTRSDLPNTYKDIGFEKELAEALQKYEGVKNPKPDRIYGLTPETHRLQKGGRIRNIVGNLMEIAPSLHHPFYLIEGKLSNGSLIAAQHQACRGGATIVRATRELLGLTRQNVDDVEGPDERTHVYSTTVDVRVIDYWVHFALVRRGPDQTKSVTYYMERLRSVAYYDEGNPENLRRICHNILEWGTLGRHAQLQSRCANIWAFEKNFLKEQAIQSHEDASKTKVELRLKCVEVGSAKKRRYEELGLSVMSPGGSNNDVF